MGDDIEVQAGNKPLSSEASIMADAINANVGASSPASLEKTSSSVDTPINSDSAPASPAKSSSASEHHHNDMAEMERRASAVQDLARSYSRVSGAPNDNPFLAGKDSPLNPNSENFNARKWAEAMVNMEGTSYRSAGVCFQDLNVHGYGETIDCQHDVLSAWRSLESVVRKVAGGGRRRRIDILRNFDGLVRSGEMLAVLGPPGSGCSTFLKTIAGEMNGIYADDAAYFNYQGTSKPVQ